MINFEFHNPTKVIFGKNVEAEAGKENQKARWSIKCSFTLVEIIFRRMVL